MSNLSDLSHFVGADLSVSATGDVLSVEGATRTQQRILRRLLTNPKDGDMPADYIFHPTYGAGLPRKVGDVINVDEMTALIRGQILLEAAVAPEPEPIVTVRKVFNGISVNIQYTDAETNTPQQLGFEVTQ